jgi:hypothetical protein
MVVVLTARSRTTDVPAVLRVGSCTGGPMSLPVCEPNVNRSIVLHPSRTTLTRLTADVPRPAKRIDAIRISLTPPGKVVRPYRSPHAALAELLLPARAWTAYPDRAFGLRIYRPWEGDSLPYDVRAVRATAAQLSSDRLRPAFSWTASAPSETRVETVESPCGGTAQCTPRSKNTTIPAGGEASFFDRPVLPRPPRPLIWSLFTRAGGSILFNATMPWPRADSRIGA